MDVISTNQMQEWLVIDPSLDPVSLAMLISSAVDVVEHETGRALRPYIDPITNLNVTPIVPASLQHAIAVFVGSHFNDREGDDTAAMATVRRLCAPFRVARL